MEHFLIYTIKSALLKSVIRMKTFLTDVLISTLVLFMFVNTSPLPNNSTTLSNNSTSLSENICTNKALLEKIKTVVNDASPGIQHLGDIPAYAATSCQQIASFRPKAESGYYWIQDNSGSCACVLPDRRRGLWRGSVDASSQC